jgi:methionyl-tRNA formyltransferase
MNLVSWAHPPSPYQSKALVDQGHNITTVITSRSANRAKQVITSPPVKLFALSKACPAFKTRTDEAREQQAAVCGQDALSSRHMAGFFQSGCLTHRATVR